VSTYVYPRGTDPRQTSTFPVVQRWGIRVFRKIARAFTGAFGGVGKRVYFLRDTIRALGEPATYLPQTIKQMYNIGVGSLPLTVIVAAFIGSVIALQTRYQLFPGVQLSVVGLISRQMIILELGPLLTGLVLTGRVGARMTAEIGLPACRSVLAFVEQRYDDVIADLMPIRRRLERFGGSHAQRDALQRTLLESALRAGRYELARALTSERLGVREASVYGWTQRARAMRGLADSAAAAEADERAAEHRTRFASV